MTKMHGSYDVSAAEGTSLKSRPSDRSPLIDTSNPLADGFYRGILQPCLAEFVATTMFVFVGTMSASANIGFTISIAIAHGFAITLLIAATSGISGGHINPAVTLGVWLSGGINTLKAVLYVISQLLGGLLGASITRGVLTETAFKAIKGGAPDLGPGVSAAQGVLCEVMLTTVLVLTVLLTAVDEEFRTPTAPIAIGFSIICDITAGSLVSGASMNPARSFGPAVAVSTYDDSVWSYHWIYWVGPGLGSLLAVFVYRFFLAGASNRLFSYGAN